MRSPALFRPGRLRTFEAFWLLVKTFNLSGLLLSHGLSVTGEFDSRLAKIRGRQGLPDHVRSYLQEALKELFERCDNLDLPASRLSVQKLHRTLEKPDVDMDALAEMWRELSGRLQDETSGRLFFAVTLREAEIFEHPTKGWEKILERFPDAIMDIEEAYKCFALARYAASVFHSVQVLERGVIALGKLVGVSDPLPGWAATVNALAAILKRNHSERTDFERQHFTFFEQMHSAVEALKNAWRNKVTHVHGRLAVMSADFSADVAEDILSATRAFMRRLATDAPWPKEESS